MSENYQEIKSWRGLKIFENLYQALETVNLGVHDLCKSQCRQCHFFNIWQS